VAVFRNTFYNAPLRMDYPLLQQDVQYEVTIVYNSPTVYRSDAGLSYTPPAMVRLTANGHEVSPDMC